MTTTSIASTLNGLFATCKDGQEGFRSAAENVRNEDFRLLFSDLSTQRQYFAGELKRLVQSLDGKVKAKGSMPAAIHRGWMHLKAALSSGDDRAIVQECERGEDAAIAEYDEVLEHNDLPVSVRSVLQHQAMGVKAAHDRVHNLLDRFQK